MRVVVDFGLCESNGVCAGIAPDVFELGDDDRLAVLPNDLPDEDVERMTDVARQCPRQAITVVAN
jgi:ferredoxin